MFCIDTTMEAISLWLPIYVIHFSLGKMDGVVLCSPVQPD